MSAIYQTSAHAAAGREGITRLDDGSLSFDLAMPGSGKAGTNPEQLFAMGYAACFDSAVKLVARHMKLPLESSETHAEISLLSDGESYKIGAKIGLRTSGLTTEQARELLAAAHKVCPYSNALRGNADVSVGLID